MLNSKIKIILISILILLSIALSTLTYYNFVYTPNLIIKSVNKNIDILNKNLSDIEKVLTSVNSKYSEFSQINNLAKAKEKINDLSPLIVDIDNIITKNNSDKKNVVKGFNPDSVEFENLVYKTQDQRNTSLKSISTVITFDTCFNNSFIDFIYNYNQVPANVSKVLSLEINANNAQNIININNEIKVGLVNMNDSLKLIMRCYDNTDSAFFPNDLTEKINADINNYAAFYEGVNNLNQKLQENNLPASLEIINNTIKKDTKSNFLQNKTYNSGIERSNLLIIDQYNKIKSLETQIDENLNNIKNKYNLN